MSSDDMGDGLVDVEMSAMNPSSKSEREEVHEDDQYDEAWFTKRARDDHEKINELLRPEDPDAKGIPFPIENPCRLEFMQEPSAWLSSYSNHHQAFAEDEHYLAYVVGLLEVVVESSPYGADKYNIWSPMLLLQKIVTVELLKERQDPMRTALKLEHHLNDFAQIENDKNSCYDRKIEELQEIPNQFARDMMNACISPLEVTSLMRVHDNTMFQDVLKSQNKKLVASKFYQKIVFQTFWGSDAMATKNSSRIVRFLHAFKRIPIFFFLNFFYYPIACCIGGEKRKKMKDQFFSPFSSYLADLCNYSILLLLLLTVTIITVPDPWPLHDLINQYNAGNISAEAAGITNTTEVKFVLLPVPTIPPVEWVLWACILTRVLTEWFQASQKKGRTVRDKIKNYLSSASNISDIVLLLFLVSAMTCKLCTFLQSIIAGIYVILDPGNSLVPDPLIYTIYLYSAGAVFALIHFLDTSTIHIPGIGPLLIAMRFMFKDITRVIVLFVFFIVGFLAPMHGMVSCYRAAHAMSAGDDRMHFDAYKSLSNTMITLIWGMFGGLSFTEKNTLYEVEDGQTAVFVTSLLVAYAIIMGLMCMNILIAMMCSTYSLVTADKSVDWRFEQFESIMEYNATTNTGSGMPFIFPMCVPYMLCCMATQSCHQGKRTEVERNRVNEFARFICQYRLGKPTTRISTTGISTTGISTTSAKNTLEKIAVLAANSQSVRKSMN